MTRKKPVGKTTQRIRKEQGATKRMTPKQKVAVKKSVDEYLSAARAGHKLPPIASASEDRVLHEDQQEGLDEIAHDVVMELGRMLAKQGYTAKTIHNHPAFKPSPRKKG